MNVYTEDNRYAVSRDGDVISFRREACGRLLKPIKHSLGYLRTNIAGRVLGIHVLVAKAYVENPDGKPEVDHIDGNKKNNASSNLRWVTHKENIQYARDRLGNWSKNAGKSRRRRVESYLGDKFVKRYRSIALAAKDMGVSYATFAPMLCRAINNDWLCCGVRWRRV